FGPFGDQGAHDISAGRDGLFYLSRGDQVKVVRSTPFSPWQPLDSIPLGGRAITASTSGGFYVAGVATESGVWLVKYAPPTVPRD
ncbi:MAG TPA: hypothetical protein VLZ30_02230, partial [Verrucomicrobiae bacterium]|nr:hypothetical protein [Verrucomicrobiae bacterium]